jgi:hypothetical protein
MLSDRMRLCLRRPLAGAALLLALLLWPHPGRLRAAGTDPTLVLAEADVFTNAAGAVALVLGGTFSFDDLVQFSFPAGVLVVQGNRFARYGFDGGVQEGTSALVTDGVSAAEVPALLASGAAAAAPARLVEVRSDGAVVVLPATLGPGPAGVVVYAVLGAEAFVSNTIALTLP